VSPRFAGLSTFGRYPRLEDVQRAAGPSFPPDWVVYGIPFDSGVTYRPGARFGPRAIREASAYLKRYSIEQAVDVPGVLSLADGGDAPVAPYDPESNARVAAEWATALPGAGSTRLLALGGDHSIALANLRATHTRLGKPAGGLALVHFDSHLDTVDAVWGEKYGHASPFIRAIEEGLVDPTKMVSIGIKGPLNTPADLDFARAHGVTIVSYEDWRWRDGAARIGEALARIGAAPAYVTIDVDVVDPAFAPGTGTPCPGGLSSSDLLHLLRQLRGLRIAGADVVEVLPDRDPGGITAFLAAHLAFEVLAADAADAAGRARA
jgi:agmatinase